MVLQVLVKTYTAVVIVQHPWNNMSKGYSTVHVGRTAQKVYISVHNVMAPVRAADLMSELLVLGEVSFLLDFWSFFRALLRLSFRNVSGTLPT